MTPVQEDREEDDDADGSNYPNPTAASSEHGLCRQFGPRREAVALGSVPGRRHALGRRGHQRGSRGYLEVVKIRAACRRQFGRGGVAVFRVFA